MVSLLPGFFCKFVNGCKSSRPACVIDQNIDAAECGHCLIDDGLDVSSLFYVAGDKSSPIRGAPVAQANKKNVSHYITFKHAMNGFTKAAAFEYGDLGITVNAISPGAIETDLMMEAGPDAAASMGVTYEEFKDTYAQESAIKRLNTVEEVASLALYLVSEQAGGMTGAILPVDGGTSL